MNSEDSEINSSEMREDSSSGHESKGYTRQQTNFTSVERPSKRGNLALGYVNSSKSRAKADSRRQIFRAQGIDPEVDRKLVADAVNFVMTASSHGCITLISKVAENMKYTRSLEEKVKLLSREKQELKSLSKHSVPITLESEMPRLTKPYETGVKEIKVDKPDRNSDFLLPGVVPCSVRTSVDQKSSSILPLKTISNLQDKEFGVENVTCLHRNVSPRNESPNIKKNCVDTETQTFFESFRKPVLTEQACLPNQLIEPVTRVPQDESNTELVTELKQQLARSQEEVKVLKMNKEVKKNCREIETQTDGETFRKPMLIDRACSPSPLIEIEKVAQFQQQVMQSEDENKIFSQEPGKKIECTPRKSLQDLTLLTRRRPSSGSSVANGSSKSFPRVKSKCGKCPCATCIEARKGHVENTKKQPLQKEEWLRVGGHVFVKGRGTGTIKYVGKLEGAGTGMYVGLYLDKQVGENNGVWHKTRLFECPLNYGVFVPVEEVQSIKRSKKVETIVVTAVHV